MRELTEVMTEEIETKANNLLLESKHNFKESVKIVKIANKKGFVVANCSIDDDTDGFILVNKKDPNIMNMNTSYLIGVNASRDYKFKRFIIAHELGHYILRHSEDELFAFRMAAHGKSEEENDIDYFSACLLMPGEQFAKEYNSLSECDEPDKTEYLSDFFIVPVESVKRRIKELNLN